MAPHELHCGFVMKAVRTRCVLHGGITEVNSYWWALLHHYRPYLSIVNDYVYYSQERLVMIGPSLYKSSFGIVGFYLAHDRCCDST